MINYEVRQDFFLILATDEMLRAIRTNYGLYSGDFWTGEWLLVNIRAVTQRSKQCRAESKG
jgi:hypothetical protein